MESSPPTHRPLWGLVLAGLMAGLVGCADQSEAPLPPPETFRWGLQPISFSPPPEGWSRERHNEWGRLGVRFESASGHIVVAEYLKVGRRDRRGEMQSLLDDLDHLDLHQFRNRLIKSKMYAYNSLSQQEVELAGRVDYAYEQALRHFMDGDRSRARREVENALVSANQLQYTLDEVVEPALFTPARLVEADSVRIVSDGDTLAAGFPMRVIDFTVSRPEDVWVGREVYIVANNHLFTASVIGGEKEWYLFNRIVASITFPTPEEAEASEIAAAADPTLVGEADMTGGH